MDLSKVKMIQDWVLIEKMDDFDNPRESGGIVIPETVNLNRRESKVGKIVAFGSGIYDKKGRWIPTLNLYEGTMIYYGRWGKHLIDKGELPDDLKAEDSKYVVCRSSGILAEISLDDNSNIEGVYPYTDQMLTKRLPREKVLKDSGIILLQNKAKPFEYEPYEVLTKGPFRYWSAGLRKMVNHPQKDIIQVGSIIWSTEQNGVQISFRQKGKIEIFRLVSFDDIIAVSEEISVC